MENDKLVIITLLFCNIWYLCSTSIWILSSLHDLRNFMKVMWSSSNVSRAHMEGPLCVISDIWAAAILVHLYKQTARGAVSDAYFLCMQPDLLLLWQVDNRANTNLLNLSEQTLPTQLPPLLSMVIAITCTSKLLIEGSSTRQILLEIDNDGKSLNMFDLY